MKKKRIWLIALWQLLQTPIALASGQITLLNTYPSDNTAFTQGLEQVADGKLIISAGLYGESSIAYLDVSTGQRHDIEPLASDYFAEGLTVTPYGIWQLTWKEQTAFLRELETLNVIKEVQYTGEGWGLAYDEMHDVVWQSNGSDTLTQRRADNFETITTVRVTYNGKTIDQLNELEYANGYLYANIWQTNFIAKIQPETGEVVSYYDFSRLLQEADITQADRLKMDVLNGIAHIEGDRFYITGKHYPLLFEVELK